ncbi:acetylserotonin methytransferase-like protein [Niveomyces insectorum RCEF 264]|uniref:Acetylserotonin methytransferase-like protein n=1 Tax=Niveomyces insectorum RCEF 264 TaxID=1081102 RepID=A0A167VIX2_9HYPO|nr:acetylserotonin methytransferase-like protein [Niveomyces insectorum RCEF 264]
MADKKSKAPPESAIPSDPPPEYTATAQPQPGSSLPLRPPPPPSSSSSTGQEPPPPLLRQPGMRKPPPPLDLPILNYLRTHRVILASASPRRKALLAQIGLTNLEVWPSTEPEDLPKNALGGWEYAAATARRKCLAVYQAALAAQEAAAAAAAKAGAGRAAPVNVPSDPELVIAADTVILSRTGQVLEKPRSAADHAQMLRHLRDTRTHTVLTAVCVLAPRQDAAHPGYKLAAHTEATEVVFARAADGLTDAVLDSYVRTREGADKAGGYALQGAGGLLLVERIEGSVDNVVGLPVRRCLQLAETAVFRQNEEDEEDEDGSQGEEEE